jgi:putative endonuclease
MWYFYIARCRDNSLYSGISTNTFKRIIKHNKGYGARWFLKHGPATIVYQEFYDTFNEARTREAQIKRWSRIKKEKLINGEYPSARPKVGLARGKKF